MPLPRDILDRVERVLDYHRLSKLAPSQPKPPAKAEPQRPSPYRLFEFAPKTALPTTLLDAATPTLTLLNVGIDALPDSLTNPPQNLKTLASWLFYSYGLTIKRPGPGGVQWLRSCPSNGAAFPCEIYVAAFAVEGLEPGFYHFSPKEFSLRKLRDGVETLGQLKRGRPDLDFLRTVPAAFLVSTIFCRSAAQFRRRGYRTSILDAGHLVQNLVAAGTGLGVRTLVRQRMTDTTMRELIGLPADMEFADAEAVQAMVVWADTAVKPMVMPKGPAPAGMESIPREALAAEMLSYGSILAVHSDCAATGVAVREIRPPLTELSCVAADFPIYEFPQPPEPDGGNPVRETLVKSAPADDFARLSFSRDTLWTINRLAFRGGAFFPLFPDGPHAALVRPFWVIHSVTGVDTGAWHYQPKADTWSKLRHGAKRSTTQAVCLDHPAAKNASAVCFIAAHLPNLMQHAGPDLYRLAHMEAGNVAQRIYLAAEASGLSCALLATFYDDEARKLIGMDKTAWEIVSAVAIGKRPGEELADEEDDAEAAE